MSWRIAIVHPDAGVSAFEDHAHPHPIIGGVSATVDGRGATKQITFRAKQTILQALPRALVFYSAPPNRTAVAGGVIVTCPPITSPGAGPADSDDDALERITAVGLGQLLHDSIVGPRLFEVETDVATIAFELCSLYAHPDLIVDAPNFPATGHVLNLFYRPEATLADALDVLVETLPGEGAWYVNHVGEIFFEYTPPPEPED